MNDMVQVKKASKYGRYFLFLVLASLVSFIWPSKNDGQSSILPTVPQAHADVPTGGDGGDSDDGGDCDNSDTGDGSDCY